MFNLYSFLYYTVSLSVLALFLLMVKAIFLDKLSPRWQYGVWSLLALRALLPLDGMGRELTGGSLWAVETVKQLLEQHRVSAFTDLNAVTKVLFPVPVQWQLPISLTDWLFVIYLAGFAATLLFYSVSYVRLRKLVKKAAPASPELQEQADLVCEAHHLHTCDIRELFGISSAFICGVIKPILVVPANTLPNEQILLHELLHLRFRDALQNLFWCFVKAVNWCNPLIRLVVDRIGNDLESLCDQRVLERLEGEARRDYGRTLLSMANERYARAPGTTSLSNGGVFIARRIEAIARFKQYPKGMALVSVCLCLMMGVSFLLGGETQAALYSRPYHRPVKAAMSLASARLFRCTTAAGALDTYAKGLIQQDRLTVAAASPTDMQMDIIYGQEDPWMAANDWQHNPDTGFIGYTVYNLVSEGDHYTAQIVYEVGPLPQDPPPDETYTGTSYAVYPVVLRQERDRWTVTSNGAPHRRQKLRSELYPIDWERTYTAESAYGHAEAKVCSWATVDNGLPVNDRIWNSGGYSFDHSLKPDAQFRDQQTMQQVQFTYTGPREGLTTAGIVIYELYDPAEQVVMPDSILNSTNNHLEFEEWNAVSGSTTGAEQDFSYSIEKITDEWNGTLFSGGGGGGTPDPDSVDKFNAPVAFCLRLFLNDEPAEDLVLREVDK